MNNEAYYRVNFDEHPDYLAHERAEAGAIGNDEEDN